MLNGDCRLEGGERGELNGERWLVPRLHQKVQSTDAQRCIGNAPIRRFGANFVDEKGMEGAGERARGEYERERGTERNRG